MTKLPITVIILTYNEEKHIARCIKSVLPFAMEVFIVDSYSTDQTVDIAISSGAKVYQNKWLNNHAVQFNWGLEHCQISTDWVMRMDADEYVTPELSKEILKKLNTLNSDITGIYVKRRVYFMGKWIKHGGYYPVWLLRIWRFKKGYCEERWMDEHIKITQGKTVMFDHDIIDHNNKNMTWWIDKHNNYATREAVDILNILYNFFQYDEVEPKFFGAQEECKRWLKSRYVKMPLFSRAFLYFFYRYFLKKGFLDGKQGLIWHFMQGFWYRFLVDAKIYEIYHKAGKDKQDIIEFFKNEYGLSLD